MPSEAERLAMKARELMRVVEKREEDALEVAELADPDSQLPLPSHIDVERMDIYLDAVDQRDEAIREYREARVREEGG